MKVKVFLDENETREDFQEVLLKALSAQENGEIHTDKFADPVMEDAANQLKNSYSDRLRDMLMQINDLLDEAQ